MPSKTRARTASNIDGLVFFLEATELEGVDECNIQEG